MAFPKPKFSSTIFFHFLLVLLISSPYALGKQRKVTVLFLQHNQPDSDGKLAEFAEESSEEHSKWEVQNGVGELDRVRATIQEVLAQQGGEAAGFHVQLIPWSVTEEVGDDGAEGGEIGNQQFEGGNEEEEREPNRLWSTEELVCRRLLNGSSLVLLVQPDNIGPHTAEISAKSTLSAAASALGFYRVPTVGVNVKDTEFSRKNLYPTFLRTSPPYSDDAVAMVLVLARLKYRQFVLITVDGDQNGAEFVTAVEALRGEHKINIQSAIALNPSLDQDDLASQVLEHLTQSTANTVLLFAKQSDAERIFTAASQFTGAGRVWLVNELAGRAVNLPKGALTVRLKQSTTSAALRDGLAVARAGLDFLAAKFGPEEDEENAPPSGCGAESPWTSSVGIGLFREILTKPIRDPWSGDPIHFNSHGDRRGLAYAVLNARRTGGQLVEVGHLDGRSELTLDERGILWPGGQRRRPSELTLPKHLRVTLVSDPPFVYTLPVDEPARCAQLEAQSSPPEIDHLPIPGPWFPCSRRMGTREELFCCSGLAVELLALLAKGEPSTPESGQTDTGFSFELHLNDSYGAVLLNEEEGGTNGGFRLSGMVGELDADRADMAIGALSINPERERFIDFSEPWLYHGIQILERWRPKHSPMESFLQPLKGSLWLSLVLAVFLVAVAIHLLDLKSPFDRFYANSEDPMFERPEMERRVTMGESLWFVWGVLLNSGVSEKTPRSFSARVLGLVWCGFCMIMVASYTANLAAFLVLDQPERALSGVNDPRLRNPSANFSLATVTHSNTYQYFKRHVELSTVFRKMEAHNQPTARSAVQALLNRSISAFVWDSIRLEFESANNCELRTRGALFGRSAYGIGLQKGSPWGTHISQTILRLSESGTLERLEHKWVRSPGGRRPCVYDEPKAPARLGLDAMRDGLVIVAVGILLGAGMSILERKLGKRKQRKRKRQQLARRYAAHWLDLIRKRKRAGTLLLQLSLAIQNVAAERQRHENFLTWKKGGKKPDMFRPELNFGAKPSRVYCPRCHLLVHTVPRPVLGRFALVCSLIFVCCLLFPCALAPIFLTCFADYEHFCPNERCKHKIGRFRRFWKPRFFV